MVTIKKKLASAPPALYMIAALLLLYGLTIPKFFTLANFVNILNQSSTLLLLACGQTLVVLNQGTDLSLGFQISVVSVLWIYMLNAGLSMPLAILLAIFSGVLMGFLNGVIVANMHIPVFIATLATANIYKSIGLLLSGGMTLNFASPVYKAVSDGRFLGLPFTVWIALGGFLLTLFVLKRTRFGLQVTALGGNAEALNLVGASSKRSTILVFTYCGLMAGLSGFVLTCRIASGNPLGGDGYEFNAVAAVLLGGTSMREGRGGVGGTIFGVLMIMIFRVGLNKSGISSLYQNLLIGLVVILALVIDAIIKRRQDA